MLVKSWRCLIFLLAMANAVRADVSATGGSATNAIAGYRIHTFTNIGTFSVASGGSRLFRLALELFEAEPLIQPVRLIGFGVSGFAVERHEQLSLFEDPIVRRDRDEKLCHTVDRLRNRLGADHIVRADAVGRRKET